MVQPNSFRSMINGAGATRTVHKLWTLNLSMSVLAITGWGTFAYSAHSSEAAQRKHYQLIAELTAGQVQLIGERNESVAYLNAARQVLTALGAELESVKTERNALKEQLATAKEDTPLLRQSIESPGTKPGPIWTARSADKSASPTPTQGKPR